MVLDQLWLLVALPIASFLVLALWGRALPRKIVALVGVGSIGLSAALALTIAVGFLTSPPPGDAYLLRLWTWMEVGDFKPQIAFYLDGLALAMVMVITIVGFLIHLYSAEHMIEDDGYSRFFAYMNLFVGSMLILVLADNLLLLYLGWEGVGLCSYLLIGFWYKEPANGRAAQKAFIVTRIGDTAMAIGLFLLITQLGTLDIQLLQERAVAQWPEGSGLAVAAALLLLGGALGKSAQLPLQTWLPDAMAGPSPVSALIHAATMVTAGVYLIARTHVLFTLAPSVMMVVAVIGAVTLLTAGISAVFQRDIKRVLAYSTISQLGYMFLALGVAAPAWAIHHLMTHACFKACLFLGAGTAIVAMHHEHDIFKMGGMRRKKPYLFWTFFLAGVGPFFSKEHILSWAWFSDRGSGWLWAAGLLGAFITSLYLFRLIFVVFFGEEKTEVTKRSGFAIRIPLIVLSVMSVMGAFLPFPPLIGYDPPSLGVVDPTMGWVLQVVGIAVAAFGVYVAYLWFLKKPRWVGDEMVTPLTNPGIRQFWKEGWGFDRVYHVLFVAPFLWAARVNRADFIDLIYRFLAALARMGYGGLRLTQNGRLRWYAAGIAFGAILSLGIAVLL